MLPVDGGAALSVVTRTAFLPGSAKHLLIGSSFSATCAVVLSPFVTFLLPNFVSCLSGSAVPLSASAGADDATSTLGDGATAAARLPDWGCFFVGHLYVDGTAEMLDFFAAAGRCSTLGFFGDTSTVW